MSGHRAQHLTPVEKLWQFLHHTQSKFQVKAVTPLFFSKRKLSWTDPVATLETTSLFIMIFYGLTTSFLLFFPHLCPTHLVMCVAVLFHSSLTVRWCVNTQDTESNNTSTLNIEWPVCVSPMLLRQSCVIQINVERHSSVAP